MSSYVSSASYGYSVWKNHIVVTSYVTTIGTIMLHLRFTLETKDVTYKRVFNKQLAICWYKKTTRIRDTDVTTKLIQFKPIFMEIILL